MEPEISTKILRNLREKLGAKLPAATRGFFMVKFARLDDDFSEFFGTVSKPNRRSIPEAKRLGKEKRKGGKEIKKENKTKKQKQKPLHEILISAHALVKMSLKVVFVERKGWCHVANAIFE